ncbi:hypothetical protein [Chromobacterium piscinae]|uniref:Uncharacterized protein n=1 Tax=Chromobacterium piscinae TaxID=686831 RepID=A0ABV0H4K8_9NEIS|nr:hypothetical protein [Chromobacterium piscinae]
MLPKIRQLPMLLATAEKVDMEEKDQGTLKRTNSQLRTLGRQ